MHTATAQESTALKVAQLERHPFVAGAKRRLLTRQQSVRWVFCAGRESRTFPQLLQGLLDWTEIPVVREVLEENLADELGRGVPEHAHFMHYVQLLDGLGVPRTEFDGYQTRAGVNFALSLAFNVAAMRNEGIAVGYMLVNEAMTPVTYEAARATLTNHFSDLQTDFFDLHIDVDAEHVQELYKAVEALPDDAESDLQFGIEIGARGMEVILDEALGMFDHYYGAIDVSLPEWAKDNLATGPQS
jgi:pyrroloquinoline quinone (PQQ) biosynthesis protein C